MTIITMNRGGSRAATTSKMECFVKPLTIITKHSILDVVAALDPPLMNAVIVIFVNMVMLDLE